MKYLLMLLLFGTGLVVGLVAGNAWESGNETEKHWDVVKSYRTQLFDASTHQYDSETGMMVIEEAIDPRPSLEALVSEGELKKVELIFPTVPASPEVTKRWLAFCNENKARIVDAYANPSYVDFKPSGTQPFFCVTYFRPRHSDVIHKLIHLIEENDQAREDNSQ